MALHDINTPSLADTCKNDVFVILTLNTTKLLSGQRASVVASPLVIFSSQCHSVDAEHKIFSKISDFLEQDFIFLQNCSWNMICQAAEGGDCIDWFY